MSLDATQLDVLTPAGHVQVQNWIQIINEAILADARVLSGVSGNCRLFGCVNGGSVVYVALFVDLLRHWLSSVLPIAFRRHISEISLTVWRLAAGIQVHGVDGDRAEGGGGHGHLRVLLLGRHH
jgi:hypothetical protein